MECLRQELRAFSSQDQASFRRHLGPRILSWAAECGQVRIVDLLIEIGIEVDAKNRFGETPLHLSVQRSHFLVVRSLLNAGASISARGEWGSTPLHFAAEIGDEKVVASLLRAGAAPNACDDDLTTPLHRTVVRDKRGAIKRLLAAGSNTTAENEERRRALPLARSMWATNILIAAAGVTEPGRDLTEARFRYPFEDIRQGAGLFPHEAGVNLSVATVDGTKPREPGTCNTVEMSEGYKHWTRTAISEEVRQRLPHAMQSYFPPGRERYFQASVNK